MFIQIRNFGGCSRADLSVKSITVVAARNARGKTSIARGVAAALAGEIYPIDGMTAGTSGQLVKQGASAASITISGADGGQVSVSYPKPQLRTEPGKPAPRATKFATGTENLSKLTLKDRIRTLTEYLKADPSKDDLQTALADIGLPQERIEEVWKNIRALGWDGARERERDQGAQYKGSWRQVTGLNYGIKIAADYMPQGWETDLAGMSVDSVTAQVNESRLQVEALIRVDAVTERELEDLNEIAKAFDARILEVAEFDGELKEVERQITAAKKHSEEMSHKIPTKIAATNPCPECGTELTVKDGKICKPDGNVPTNEELKAALSALEKAKTEEESLRGVRDVLKAERRNAELRANESKKAVETLKAFKDSPPAIGSKEHIEDAKRELAHVEKRLKALELKTEADRLHQQVLKTADLVNLLDSTGIRQQKLARVLNDFNAELADISGATKSWQTVQVTPELNITYGGRFFELCAESEQFRCNVVLRLALAKLDSSALVIVDGSDLLAEKILRKGLFFALRHVGIPALVMMAVDGPDDAPDLGKSGWGETYWLNEEAVAEPLNVAVAA